MFGDAELGRKMLPKHLWLVPARLCPSLPLSASSFSVSRGRQCDDIEVSQATTEQGSGLWRYMSTLGYSSTSSMEFGEKPWKPTVVIAPSYPLLV